MKYGLMDAVGGIGEALKQLNTIIETRRQQNGIAGIQQQAPYAPFSPSPTGTPTETLSGEQSRSYLNDTIYCDANGNGMARDVERG